MPYCGHGALCESKQYTYRGTVAATTTLLEKPRFLKGRTQLLARADPAGQAQRHVPSAAALHRRSLCLCPMMRGAFPNLTMP